MIRLFVPGARTGLTGFAAAPLLLLVIAIVARGPVDTVAQPGAVPAIPQFVVPL